MKIASYSSTLSRQIADFRRGGFAVIRRSDAVSDEFVTSVNKGVLDYFDSIESSWKYRFWRLFHSVSTSKKRHSIPLPFTTFGVMELVRSSISHIHPLLQSQLSADAPLVELSSIISQSGSGDQDVHTDVPFTSPLIICGLIALTTVTLENGPTCVFAGSHTEAFHGQLKPKEHSNFFCPDGHDIEKIEFENSLNDFQSTDSRTKIIQATYFPQCVTLNAGDILLFDTKLAHHGLANRSKIPRALLCFAFQEPITESLSSQDEEYPATAQQRCIPKVDGFTYHFHSSMIQARLHLDSFAISL